jgi:hypothetical protein
MGIPNSSMSFLGGINKTNNTAIVPFPEQRDIQQAMDSVNIPALSAAAGVASGLGSLGLGLANHANNKKITANRVTASPLQSELNKLKIHNGPIENKLQTILQRNNKWHDYFVGCTSLINRELGNLDECVAY